MDFKTWIYKKYIEWCGDSRNTITEYAKYIGVSQPVMSSWLSKNGYKPGNKDSIEKLVAKYGNEVYEVLGLPLPENLSDLPPSIRKSFTEALHEINSIYAKLGISAVDPKAEEVALKVLNEHGFIITSIENIDDD